MLGCAVVARAQVAGSLGVVSEARYRGAGNSDIGTMLRGSVMVDSPYELTEGLYGGVSGLWRARDQQLAYNQAVVGWAGRLNRLGGLEALDAGWGWDLGAFRTHFGHGPRADFHELMVGLLAPSWSARAWWAKHYYVGSAWSLYLELNASLALDAHWRIFAHLGNDRYGESQDAFPSLPDSADASAGVSYVLGDWQLRLTREGLIKGNTSPAASQHGHHPAWVSSISVAF